MPMVHSGDHSIFIFFESLESAQYIRELEELLYKPVRTKVKAVNWVGSTNPPPQDSQTQPDKKPY
jgi:hypothetical protein